MSLKSSTSTWEYPQMAPTGAYCVGRPPAGRPPPWSGPLWDSAGERKNQTVEFDPLTPG